MNMKQSAKRARAREDKVQALAWAQGSEARKERQRMVCEPQWQKRNQTNVAGFWLQSNAQPS